MNDEYYLYAAVVVFVLLAIGVALTAQEFRDMNNKDD
jgi:hypothetical protein